MPKLGSKKSRGGCTNCKRRRVKCDEIKPSCANCSKYQMQCVYMPSNALITPHERDVGDCSPKTPQDVKTEGLEPQHPVQQGSSHSLSVLADAVSSVEAHSQTSPSVSQASPVSGIYQSGVQQQTPFNFTILDLELLHRFTVTAYSPIARLNTFDVWRLHVPKLAYTREWLMRGMIAISAMHLVSDPQTDVQRLPELLQVALTSMNSGLPNLNHLVAVISLDDTEGCSAIASYAALVAIYALAMPSVQHFACVRAGKIPSDKPLEDTLAQLVANFELVRGTGEVYRQIWHVIRQGPVAPITYINLFSWHNDEPPELDDLLSLNCGVISEAASEQEFDEPRRQLMQRTRMVGDAVRGLDVAGSRAAQGEGDFPHEAGEALRLAYNTLYLTVKKMLVPDEAVNRGIVLAWPATLQGAYMDLLRERSPPALALLTIWALVLRESSWLTMGWKGWITRALNQYREDRRRAGDDVDNVWWDTIAWGAEVVAAHPRFLEFELKDEGLT